MSKKFGACLAGLILLVGGHLPAYGQNSATFTWVNPAYRDVFTGEDLVEPRISLRSSPQYTCTSEADVMAYLRENFLARNVQISFNMVWGFGWGEVSDILSRARAGATAGDDYLEYCMIGESRSCSGRDGDVVVDMAVTYVANADEEAQVDSRVEEILTSLINTGMNPEEKGKKIHNWVVANVEYDLTYMERSAYAALFKGKTVCQGYALLVYKMLDRVGIPARIVRSERMSHAWNMVDLCGNWYHVDATWDDPVPDVPDRVLEDFLYLSDAEIGETHYGWKESVPDAPEAPIGYVKGVCDEWGESLTWIASKAEAMSLALAQGKQVLLMAGRPTCGNCRYMQDTVCESADPPIREEILAHYIPWYVHVDESNEWWPYASGLGEFFLPLICRIDPADPDRYLDRTTGVQYPDDFYNRIRISTVEKGDVDHRDGVNLADAILALRTAAGIPTPGVFADADVNGDGRIGVIDAIYILQKVGGLRP